MNLNEIIEIANGKLLNPSLSTDIEIIGGCGSDLMSDVLASVKPNAVLLTGLCNPQVIRTANMADISAVIFLRGKLPTSEMIAMATAESIPLISTENGMFDLCGKLQKAGLRSFESNMNGSHE